MKKKNMVVVKKDCFSRMSLLGIFNAGCNKIRQKNLLNGYVEDPRVLRTATSGMTILFDNGLTAQGFTLIELLVVVLIIAILAAVAVPQYQKVVKKSRGTEALAVAKALHQALAVWELEYSDNLIRAYTDELNIIPPKLHDFQYCTSSGCHNIWQLDQVISGKVTRVQLVSYLFLQSKEGLELMVGTGTRLDGHVLVPQIYCEDSVATDNANCEDYFNCQREYFRGWKLQIDSNGNEYKSFSSGGKCLL